MVICPSSLIVVNYYLPLNEALALQRMSMNTFIKWLILILLLLGAAVSYSSGFSEGTWGFIILGAIFELSFWVGLFTIKDGDKEKYNE